MANPAIHPNPSRDRKGAERNIPLAYLITFTGYGTWLHGSESGSVDGDHNIPGTSALPPDAARLVGARRRLDQPPFELNARRREIVLQAIQEVCAYRGWSLYAAHVRMHHGHTVVQALEKPERVMNALKAYASRRLAEAGLDGADRKRWTRHGGTCYLWSVDNVIAAIRYVVEGQGAAMAMINNIAGFLGR